MSSNARSASESTRPMDVGIVLAYGLLVAAWLAISPLRAQSVGPDGIGWYLRTHLCALQRQVSCDE